MAAASEIDWDSMDKPKFFLYGMGAFSGVTTLLYPLTVVKTKIQASHGSSTQGFKGALHTAKAVVGTEGIAGLYRGYATIVLGMIPGRMVYMAALEVSKSAINRVGRQLEVNEMALAGISSTLAGACASLSTQVIVVPVDVISQRQMVAGAGVEHAKHSVAATAAAAQPAAPLSTSPAVQAAAQAAAQPQAKALSAVSVHAMTMPPASSLAATAAKSSSSHNQVHQLHTVSQSSPNMNTVLSTLKAKHQLAPTSLAWSVASHARQSTAAVGAEYGGLAVARAVVREEGLAGLYRGFGASIMTFVPSSAIWWGSYSIYQRLFWSIKDTSHRDPDASRIAPPPTGEVIQIQTVAALFAGATASFATSPLDLVKTRIQVASRGDGEASTIREVLMEILKEDGWRGMFRGAVPRMANAALWGTCMVTTYEFLKRVAKKDFTGGTC